MKVLLTTQPGLGHFNPMVPLAHALQHAGHEVAFACAKSFCPTVETVGLRAFPAGLDWLMSEAEKTFPELKDMSQEEKRGYFMEVFADTAANAMARDVLKLCTSWQPDIIVCEVTEFGGCIAAECLGIIHAAVNIELLAPSHIAKQTLEKPLAYLRSVYGLTPYPALDMLNRYLLLSYIPPSYQSPEHPPPPFTHIVQWPASLHEKASLPEWVAQLPKRPTICASMGTVLDVPEVFEIILDGLSDDPINLIATVGRLNPTEFNSLPENVHVEQYIPLAPLLPYCDLVITHGGVNTIMATLSCGLPVLVIPFASQLLQHGMRCEALGAGKILLPPGSDFANKLLGHQGIDDMSADTVHAAVWELLTDPSYRQSAQSLQAEIASLPKLDYAVALLERLAVEREPILRC